MLETPEERLEKDLQQYKGYCEEKMKQFEEPSYYGDIKLGEGAIWNLDISGEKIIVLDKAELTCGDGHNGNCGSGGCWITVYFQKETVEFQRKLWVINQHGRQLFFFCGGSKSYTSDEFNCETLEEIRRLGKDD